MGVSDLDPDAHERRPWNAGNIVGAKRPLKPRDVRVIRFSLDEHRRLPDRARFDLAINSKLRRRDIIKTKTGDIVTAHAIQICATVIQKKTGRPVQFELMTEVCKALRTWLDPPSGSKPEPRQLHGPFEHPSICPPARRMGAHRRYQCSRIRSVLNESDKSVIDL